MKILALDTATSSGSIAVIDNRVILAEYTLTSKDTHSRRILPTIDMLLKNIDLSLDDMDLFAVTAGPGSFTGLRIGLATMKGLVMATEKPVVAISTLDALAANFSFACIPVFAVIDARKKQVFCAGYRPDGKGAMDKFVQDTAVTPEGFIKKVSEPSILAGDGVLAYRRLIEDGLGNKAILAPEHLCSIRASNVAALALDAYFSGGSHDPDLLVPKYIRPSDAKIKFPDATICIS